MDDPFEQPVNTGRTPKSGEHWRRLTSVEVARIANVYDDCLTYWYEGRKVATTLDDFTTRYAPPAPTVVGSMFLFIAPHLASGIRGSYFNEPCPATHAVQLMSDGDFRVVRL